MSSTRTKSDEVAGGAGVLWVVSTPIGNLEDVTLRALRILREADAVIAEDTRRTRVLLSHHGIATKLVSFHAHSPSARVDALADQLASGARLALVTDAGTPIVSDPGVQLVDAARARSVRVEAIPGPSAVTAALVVAGVRCDVFRFVGFLPRSGGRRTRALDEIAAERGATILFEAPGRLAATLRDLAARLPGERTVAVCRELTKLHEEVVRGSADALAARFAEEARGEVTIVIEGTGAEAGAAEALDDEEIEVRIESLLETGASPSDVARQLARETSLSRAEAYRRVLRHRESGK